MDRELVESCYSPAALDALKHFPVDAKHVELIAHTENVTFRVSCSRTGYDYVLRLHRPGYNSIEELESERAWTRSLKDMGLRVPVSLPTHGGSNFVQVDIPGTGEQRYVGMTTWFTGSPLSDYLETSTDKDERKRIFHRIGEIAATLHNHTAEWHEPPGFQRRRLDLDGLLGEAPIWGRFWDHEGLTREESDLLLQTRNNVRETLSDYGERPDNFGLIHTDLHPDNIVYDGENLSLIDFDDSAYGWHMYDIASILVEDKFDPGPESPQDVLLEGYREHRPLPEADTDLLGTFLLIRGMAILGWFHQRPEHTGSPFYEKVRTWVVRESRKSILR
jgi:Ser/Thr protein kinase RdoA (MazF antagonist)